MTESSEQHQLPEDLSSFENIDPYEVLGLDSNNASSITSSEIKKAYRLRALKCHPDKAKTDEERAKFHTEFQTVALAYSVLGDETRRRRYDNGGSMEEAMRDDGLNGEDGTSMREFFEDLWKSHITTDIIEKDKEVYRNGGEERADILKYYVEGKGNMEVVMENVLHSLEDDEPRFRKVIEEAIDNGEVKSYKAFTAKVSAKTKAARAKAAQREAEEAAQLSKELGLDDAKKRGKKGKGKDESDEDSLRALIQSRGQKRMSSLLDNLESKYGGKSNKDSSKSKKKQKVEDAEPTEDEFTRIQAEMEERRRSNKKSSKIKSKLGTKRGRN